MECHKCRHSAAVESGKYWGRFFRHSPCYRCELTHNSHYTMEFKPWMHERAAGVDSEPEPDRGPLWEAMLEMARVILSLRPEYRNCVCWRLQGISAKEGHGGSCGYQGSVSEQLDDSGDRSLPQDRETNGDLPGPGCRGGAGPLSRKRRWRRCPNTKVIEMDCHQLITFFNPPSRYFSGRFWDAKNSFLMQIHAI
jgi:hypothetical protein